MDDLGKGLGPAVVALLEERVGRSSAIWYGIATFTPCALCTALIGKTIVKDEASLQLLRNFDEQNATYECAD